MKALHGLEDRVVDLDFLPIDRHADHAGQVVVGRARHAIDHAVPGKIRDVVDDQALQPAGAADQQLGIHVPLDFGILAGSVGLIARCTGFAHRHHRDRGVQAVQGLEALQTHEGLFQIAGGNDRADDIAGRRQRIGAVGAIELFDAVAHDFRAAAIGGHHGATVR